MRILFVTPTPPLRSKPRPHHFIRALASLGHEVHLVMEVPGGGAGRPVRGPGWEDVVAACASVTAVDLPRRRWATNCLLSLPTRTPLRVAYCRSDAFRAAAEGVAAGSRCDGLIVDRERLAPLFRHVDLPKVLDATDCMTLYLRRCLRWARGGERAVAAAELVKMPAYERRMGDGYRAVTVSSREDAAALRDVGSRTPVTVVPNGVGEARAVDRRPEPGLIAMVGTMSYAPNVDGVLWFARSVLPLIRASRPDVRLAVVGRDPTRAVRSLAADPGIEVTGAVPDVTPWLERATVLVAPIRIGGGFPNKVAEAMAAGVPVVATPAASAGLDGATPGQHVLSADTPEDFAQACLNVLRDPELGSTLAAGGLALVRSLPRWADVARMLVDLLAGPGPSPQGPSKSEAS